MKQKLYLQGVLVVVLVLGGMGATRVFGAESQAVAVVNGGFEQEGATAGAADGWVAFGKGYSRSNAAVHEGNWSVEAASSSDADSAGATQVITLNQEIAKPVFVGAYVKGEGIVKAAGTTFGASLYLEIHEKSGTVKFLNSLANSGTFDWRWIGLNTASSGLVTEPIDYIKLSPSLSRASGRAWFDSITVAEYEPEEPAVTLMFDDGESSTLTAAKPLLDEYGYVGTSAVIAGYMNSTDPRYMRQAEVKSLFDDGWEIAAHSMTHPDLTLLSEQQAASEMEDSKRLLEETGVVVNSFAYPYGAYNAQLNAEAARLGYVSSRAFELGSNPAGVYPYDIKVRVVRNGTTAAEVQSWLAEAKENKHWMVLAMHGINDSGTEYAVPVSTLRSFLDAVQQSGVEVVSYTEGLQLFAVNGDNIAAVHPQDGDTPADSDDDSEDGDHGQDGAGNGQSHGHSYRWYSRIIGTGNHNLFHRLIRRWLWD